MVSDLKSDGRFDLHRVDTMAVAILRMRHAAVSAVMDVVLAVAVYGCTPMLSGSPPPNPCAVATCNVQIRTRSAPPAPQEGCPLTTITGVLVSDPAFGIGLRYESGKAGGAIWPFGYSAIENAQGIELLNRTGEPVAHEGDRVRMDGWIDPNSLISHPCDPPHLQVLAPSSSRDEATPTRET
jgi:hypothetical protein